MSQRSAAILVPAAAVRLPDHLHASYQATPHGQLTR